MLHHLAHKSEMSPLGRAVREVIQITKGAPMLWHFGTDAQGSFITNRAFLAYLPATDQATLMIAMGLLPGIGSWDAGRGQDVTRWTPVPTIAPLVAAYTSDDPVAVDTTITVHSHPTLPRGVRLFRVDDRLVGIDARYASLLAGSPVRVHGPRGQEALWVAEAGMPCVAAMQIQAEGDAAWDTVLAAKLGELRRTETHDLRQTV